ncbi:MAG: capsular biosynthesis protein [Clostridiaceae bacterium]|nr:capsular biosynthesis protein [Clostridiaceae bacterium]
MIDIHSHILPGIDDGSKSISVTLEMLRTAEKDGTKDIIATPHFCREYGELPFKEVKKLVGEFNKVARGEGINVNIHYGQEVYYSERMIDDYNQGIIGTIDDSRYMLLEFPMMEFEKEYLDIIYELQVKNIVPILAHPERYKFLKEKPSDINMLIDEGVLFQMNSGSITGKYGSQAKRTAHIFLENGIYNFIGSDAHNNGSRNTVISDGVLEATKINKCYKKLFEDSALKLLNDELIDFRGQNIKEKKSLFSFFSKR